jgi:hypothetical protein
LWSDDFRPGVPAPNKGSAVCHALEYGGGICGREVRDLAQPLEQAACPEGAEPSRCIRDGTFRARLATLTAPPERRHQRTIGPTTNPTTFGSSSGRFIPPCSSLPAWKCSFSAIFRERPRRASRSYSVATEVFTRLLVGSPDSFVRDGAFPAPGTAFSSVHAGTHARGASALLAPADTARSP